MFSARLIAGTSLAFAVFAGLCLLGLGPIHAPLRSVVVISAWMALGTALVGEAALAILPLWLASIPVALLQTTVLWALPLASARFAWSHKAWILVNGLALSVAYVGVARLILASQPVRRYTEQELQKISATRTILDPGDQDGWDSDQPGHDKPNDVGLG